MVTKEQKQNSIISTKTNKKVTEQPPPLDEGWWEAVLAEEEAENGHHSDSVMHPPTQSSFHQQPGSVASVQQLPEQPEINWEKAGYLYEHDQTVTLTVESYNRGGLLVSGEELQGFVPVSHLIETPCNSPETEAWLQAQVNRNLTLKIIECDPERGRMVFSERAALSEPGSRIALLNRLQPGDCIRGAITNITEFGIFVDLGGVEGLIHVSEISWGRVHHPADVVMLGQTVEVYVIQVDRERARVALSLKRMHPNPWETAQDRYFPGQVTEAVVTSIVSFGAFARLEDGLDGLIHISEMEALSTEDPEVLSGDSPSVSDSNRLPTWLHEGQRVKVRVLHVDCGRQRLGLSLRVDDD
jgi:small subunit ribosomal protein S1